MTFLGENKQKMRELRMEKRKHKIRKSLTLNFNEVGGTREHGRVDFRKPTRERMDGKS